MSDDDPTTGALVVWFLTACGLAVALFALIAGVGLALVTLF